MPSRTDRSQMPCALVCPETRDSRSSVRPNTTLSHRAPKYRKIISSSHPDKCRQHKIRRAHAHAHASCPPNRQPPAAHSKHKKFFCPLSHLLRQGNRLSITNLAGSRVNDPPPRVTQFWKKKINKDFSIQNENVGVNLQVAPRRR